MTTDRPRRPRDLMAAAEAVFKPPAPKLATPNEPSTPKVPGVKQVVSLRLDEDVIEHFQADGPGWQERINAALRKVMA